MIERSDMSVVRGLVECCASPTGLHEVALVFTHEGQLVSARSECAGDPDVVRALHEARSSHEPVCCDWRRDVYGNRTVSWALTNWRAARAVKKKERAVLVATAIPYSPTRNDMRATRAHKAECVLREHRTAAHLFEISIGVMSLALTYRPPRHWTREDAYRLDIRTGVWEYVAGRERAVQGAHCSVCEGKPATTSSHVRTERHRRALDTAVAPTLRGPVRGAAAPLAPKPARGALRAQRAHGRRLNPWNHW